MAKKIVNLVLLFLVGTGLFLVDQRFPDVNLQKGYLSALAVAICYLLLKVLLDELVVRRVHATQTRYSLRKVNSLVFLFILVVVILRIWVPNPQALLVSYGLIAAGVAIALQDVFKNIVGGVMLFLNSMYRVGDRVEINGTFGDVIDIGLFYTTLLEIKGWVGGDQATGRIVSLPNGNVLSQPVQNYTRDHNFIWDEIVVPITYESNWQAAVTQIKTLVTHETAALTKQAESGITSLEKKYYVSKRNVEPDIFIVPTDNWIAFHIRYISGVRERRILNTKLVTGILELIQASSDIAIASNTLTIHSLSDSKMLKK